MFTRIDGVLQPTQLATLTGKLAALEWEDGYRTAGAGKNRKNNKQLTRATPAAIPLLEVVSQQVMRHPRVRNWAAPDRTDHVCTVWRGHVLRQP